MNHKKMEIVWSRLLRARHSGNFRRIHKWEKKMERVSHVMYPWNAKYRETCSLFVLKRKVEQLDLSKYKWDWCGTCHAPFIRCPQCGNNCCNAGYGKVDQNGNSAEWGDLTAITCPTCSSAYDVQSYMFRIGKSPSRKDFPNADEMEKVNDMYWNTFGESENEQENIVPSSSVLCV